MRWKIVSIVGLALAAATVDAAYADDSRQCWLESIQATFAAETSTYRVEAGCMYYHPLEGPVPAQRLPAHWSSQGSYDSRTGLAREDVMIESGTVTTTLFCPSDPWLGSSLQPGMVRCTKPTFETRKAPVKWWLTYLHEGFYSRTNEKIGPLPNSTGFPYDRAALIAQRDAALKAEAAAAAAALQQQNQRLKQAKQPGPALIAPIILSPMTNALFISGTNVPIKLAPPREWVDTQVGLDGKPMNNNRLYMVRLERKDAAGNWVPHTTLPVGAVQAESPTGFTGFGSGAPPGGVSTPGAWRLSAQMSSPTATRWSDWVEFAVTSPNKAIQKTPKMFGQ
ncbi:exported protein of unknown function [Nitrospira japonica]|uniref:Uncharacterized protein n=1 Tax=Nitrospira japonica TaxID=1325564 RepID=A0A1W1I878_9BACT|nr:hypothetical protein [Nitrospira japonica]SLM49206.1 exported protein of unknown function [Nitrospira japonica]